MRDYSFGNCISALRMRRGLSQYQLGALVGVSDKAVSKWENGVSKPRMNTIMKLAEVLDVGINELLTAEKGKFKDDLQQRDLASVIVDLFNPKFMDLLAISGFLYGTGVWEDNGENLYTKGIPLQEMITNREDVYTYLRSKLDEECCGDPSGEAYDIMQKVRKGMYVSNRMPADLESLLQWWRKNTGNFMISFRKDYEEVVPCKKEPGGKKSARLLRPLLAKREKSKSQRTESI